jgi:hypothetical protein
MICRGEISMKQKGIQLNGTHRLLVSADAVRTRDENINTTKENTEAALDAGKEVFLEVQKIEVHVHVLFPDYGTKSLYKRKK